MSKENKLVDQEADANEQAQDAAAPEAANEPKAPKAPKRIPGVLYPEDYPTPHDYEVAREEQRQKQRVPIFLPKDNENYKNDVVVQINGKIYQIHRGVQVDVPIAVAEILKASQNQEMLAIKRLEENTKADVFYGER